MAAVALLPAPLAAQLEDREVVDIVRECRRIADTAARTACYDGIPLGPATAAAAAAQPNPAPDRGAASFGSQQLPRARAPEAADRQPDRLTATVVAAVERAPGIYLLTLENGAQWQFVDAMPSSYDPPRRGSAVEIAAAALGSYLLAYADQRTVRIRRVR